MSLDKLPRDITCLRQWVCANSDTKQPIQANNGYNASSTNPNTWTCFEETRRRVDEDTFQYVGFVFNDNGIVGIDIDKGYEDDGFLSSLACDIIGKCKSYTEKSKSGRGFHILVRGDIPFKGKNNLKGVEIYKQSRYFIMTGDVLLYDKIIENQEAIDYILDKYFPTTRETNNKNVCSRIYTPTWEKPGEKRIKLRPVYPLIPDGCRNISLTSLAGMLHNQGYNPQQIYDELIYCNTVACEPMLDEREIETIVNSVTRYKR